MFRYYVIAAISPTGSGFKIAFTDPEDFLLDWMEFGEREISRMMRYLTEQKEFCSELRVTGCRNDRWPPALVKSFEWSGLRLH